MPKLDSIREVVKKIASIEELRGKICFFGGAMPYIYHGEESGRDHSDIDVLVDEECMDYVRKLLKEAGIYRQERDSLSLGLDRDYGLKVFIDGVYVEFEPMMIKDGYLSRASFSPDKKVAGTEVTPFLEIEDIMVPVIIDGIQTLTESMELIRASKAKYGRKKDIDDIAFIDGKGIDSEKYERVVAYLRETVPDIAPYEELRNRTLK